MTKSYVELQEYFDSAPRGIDARYAWTKTGGRGQDIRIIDIEANWQLDHEDLPSTFFQAGDIGSNTHGTAVFGMLAAVRNGYGMTGLASDATVGISSVINKPAGSTMPGTYNVARAIERRHAAAALWRRDAHRSPGLWSGERPDVHLQLRAVRVHSPGILAGGI